METILFFEPRLLRLSKEKKNPKNGKVWDIDKIKLLRRILDGRQIQLVLTSFNIQKDAADEIETNITEYMMEEKKKYKEKKQVLS